MSPAEIAQLVEHCTENAGVRSSNLRLGTKRKWLSGRASPCQGEGRRFDPGLPLQRKPAPQGAGFRVGWAKISPEAEYLLAVPGLHFLALLVRRRGDFTNV